MFRVLNIKNIVLKFKIYQHLPIDWQEIIGIASEIMCLISLGSVQTSVRTTLKVVWAIVCEVVRSMHSAHASGSLYSSYVVIIA